MGMWQNILHPKSVRILRQKNVLHFWGWLAALTLNKNITDDRQRQNLLEARMGVSLELLLLPQPTTMTTFTPTPYTPNSN